MSFFGASERNFNSAEQLVRYLKSMAENKVVDATRKRIDTYKYDLAREEPLATSDEEQEQQRMFASGGTPSETAIGRETWKLMLNDEPPVYRAVLKLLRDGATQEEVAAHLKLSRKTVGRILQRALEKTRS